mgnify:CR=1 FL=1
MLFRSANANTSFGDFARSFIRNILLMIAQARVLQAIQSSPGLSNIFGALAGAVSTRVRSSASRCRRSSRRRPAPTS